jgi:integral membrane protein
VVVALQALAFQVRTRAAMSGTAIRQLRVVGLLEGFSFIALLGIAMPLKYLAGMPRAVSVVGMVHGVLFLLYLFAIVHAQLTVRWPLRKVLGLLVAAIVPLGPFFAEGWLRREQQAAEQPSVARSVA